MRKKLVIIGAGISGLSAACYAAKDGYDVTVLEKHEGPGGRARQFKTDNGFTFDMGPSWYWMPDIIERFFKDFGYTATDFYTLTRLDPQFDMVFEGKSLSIPDSYDAMKVLFETEEGGAGKALDKYMNAAAYKYKVGMHEFVNKPSLSWMEFMSPSLIHPAFKLNLLSNMEDYTKSFFANPYLRSLMEFPVIFLGAKPKQIPAMYSLMNYGGYKLGTWYPQGGFYALIDAMYSIAKKLGVQFKFNHDVRAIHSDKGVVQSIETNEGIVEVDSVISSADYQFTEQLLDQQYRNYDEAYWEKRVFAPSCLIYYLGLNCEIPSLRHHTLFFEHDLENHLQQVYDQPKWPDKPLFYACNPSKTDPTVAPPHCENLFLLMPIAPGLEEENINFESYLDDMLARIEKYSGTSDLRKHIIYKKRYCIKDFKEDYNAYKGNAYGLANTLNQTAVLKPKIRNRKLKNLLYTGQLTVPGPGVPPSIISGKIAAQLLSK